MISSFRRKPAYLVISDALRERIENKELRSGDRFPTERELVEEFGVARMTVRHALDMLQLEGLIDRRRGRTGGTFVRSVPPVIHLEKLDNIDAQLRELGGEVRTHVVDVERRTAPRTVANVLGVDEKTEVWTIKRVRNHEGGPISFVVHNLPVDLFPDLGEADLSQPPYGGVVYKRESVAPIMPNPEQQERLAVTRLQPLLRMTRVVWNEAGEAVDYIEECVRTEALGVEIEAGTLPQGLSARPSTRLG